MITKYISFNGRKTSDFGLRLIDDVEFASPERSVELIEINGSNGALIRDNKRLGTIKQSFPFQFYGTNEEAHSSAYKVADWLLNSPIGWNDLVLSWDSEFVYKALFYESFNVSGSLKAKKRCVLNFEMHPIKYFVNGLVENQVTSGSTLNNPSNRTSKPLIRLVGTGDVDLVIGTQMFKLRGVSGHIIIDCETQSAYKSDNTTHYDKVHTYPFPTLSTGNNLIRWNNNAFKVYITPRWEAIV